ncbi:Uncharacterised protein [Mycobacterium xenopi]|uniref:Uncharacterized protein n=1 Tax=Mycobacterium xenopi TaxID=1789 RepID=A0AAD1GYQ9_MYCXE|nr:hypothetical protein I552_1311 [Mycobacterium xenopi 3993]BBU21691.1 hypothetical protein MYXE_14800 [Mycobacterium xenopi]SPX93483.1 Uncharacterised protein [Mycobacterium xenopi]
MLAVEALLAMRPIAGTATPRRNAPVIGLEAIPTPYRKASALLTQR